MASGEFVEKLLIQCVTLFSCARRHEDVAPNVLVHYLTVCIHTTEGYVDVAVKLDGHLEERENKISYSIVQHITEMIIK